MARRRRLAMAGGVFATVFAATVALGANYGLFGLTRPNSPVGRIPAASATVGSSPGTADVPAPRPDGHPDFASPDADD